MGLFLGLAWWWWWWQCWWQWWGKRLWRQRRGPDRQGWTAFVGFEATSCESFDWIFMITYYVFVVCICECEQNFALISICHVSFCIVFFLLGILCYKKYKCLSFNLSLHLPPVPIMRMPSSLSTTTTTTSTSTSSRLPLACSPIHVGHRLLPPRAVPPDQSNQILPLCLCPLGFWIPPWPPIWPGTVLPHTAVLRTRIARVPQR